MFGIILDNQNSESNNTSYKVARLFNNPIFKAVPNSISEETLYNLIKDAYDTKIIEKLEKYYNTYIEKGFTKNLEQIIKYIDEIK